MATPFLRVHIVRHGQSFNNVLLDGSFSEYAVGRQSDAQLSSLGEMQADATRKWLVDQATSMPSRPSLPITQVYCSAMDRAAHTASRMCCDTGLSPRIWPAVCEIGGIFEHIHSGDGGVVESRGVPGMTASKLKEKYPTVAIPMDGSIDESGWWKSAHKENDEEGRLRVKGIVNELLKAASLLPKQPEGTPLLDVRSSERRNTEAAKDSASTTHASAHSHALESSSTSSSSCSVTAATSGAEPGLHLPIDAHRTLGDSGVSPARNTVYWSGEDGSLSRSLAIVIVAHADFMDYFLQTVTGRASDTTVQFCHSNCSVTTLDMFADGAIKILGINEISHLLRNGEGERPTESLITGSPLQRR